MLCSDNNSNMQLVQRENNMEAIHLMLADATNISREGKLNVLGIFNHINARQFPAMHAQMYVIAELIAGPAEYDTEREITIKILDSDAQDVIVNWRKKIAISRPTKGVMANIKQILELKNLVFPKPDTYRVSLLVDNEEKMTTKLLVEEISGS